MRVELKRLNDKTHFEGVNEDGNKVLFDGSPKIGGEGNGARPMQVVLMALAACSSMDMVVILHNMGQKVDDYNVIIDAERDEENMPAVFTKIHMKFILKGDVLERKALSAAKLAVDKYCSVGKMLVSTAEITHSVEVNA